VRNRSGNPDDETSTRASISRIVMLAEALFEVDLITKLATVHLTSVFDLIFIFYLVYTKINDFIFYQYYYYYLLFVMNIISF
jgi:hypothetical protein